MKYVAVTSIKKNPNNPRIIKDEGFKQLKESLCSSKGKEHFEARPCIVSTRTGENIIIAGNTRYQAAKDLGWTEVPVVILEGLTEEEEKEIIVRDNVSNGEWDWEKLVNEYNPALLTEWGVVIPGFGEEEQEDKYTKTVEAPVYEITGDKPNTQDLFDKDKYELLLEEIEKTNCTKQEKEFLRFAATRHIVFNYGLIAEYYAHSSKDMQETMEKLALVIIDFKKAIENGFVQLTQRLDGAYEED